MQQLTITIPKYYNDGTAIPENRLQAIESDLLDLYGGFSRIDVYGAWTDIENGGHVYHDYSYQYEILLSDNARRYGDLKHFAKHLCTILDQKCILTTLQNINADFVENDL